MTFNMFNIKYYSSLYLSNSRDNSAGSQPSGDSTNSVFATAKGDFKRTSPSLRDLSSPWKVAKKEGPVGPDWRFLLTRGKHRFCLFLMCFAVGFVLVGFIVGLIEYGREVPLHTHNGNGTDIGSH